MPNSSSFSPPITLPIHDLLHEIQEALAEKNNLVLQAEPGAGKSTVVPLDLLNAPWLLKTQKIIMLEPRRVAARSIAHYLARQLGESVGERVGYQVKNDRKIGKHTQLEIVTEGILTRRLQTDPELQDVSLIIFDEFHERSLQADLGLMLALEIQQTLREDLKLVVMSATIDTEFIARYLDGADTGSNTSVTDEYSTTIIKCPGRAFPVDVKYLDGKFYQLSDHVLSALHQVFGHADQGDVLVFLPGQADISRCLNRAKESFPSSILFLPLLGSLSLAQQEQAIQPDSNGRRKIIFTTNIAETSLTIEGVSWVIDSGLEKQTHYDPASGMTRLETVFIAKSSAEQRKGRAGRLRAGHCIRLWSESKQASLIDFQPEEIMTAELANLVLELYAWGQTDYQQIDWLTAPPLGHYQTAVSLLSSLGFITGAGDKKEQKDLEHDENNKKRELTELGRQAARLGVHPRLAAMLLHGQSSNNTPEKTLACELAALLNEQDIFSRGGNHQALHRTTDISERFLALQEFKNNKKDAVRRYALKRHVVEQVMNSSRNLFNALPSGSIGGSTGGSSDVSKITESEIATHTLFSDSQNHLSVLVPMLLVPTLLVRAYPDRLAKQRRGTNRYVMANGKGVFLADDDALAGSEWLVVSDCDAQKREGRIYLAAAIDKQQVVDLLSPHFVKQSSYKLDDKKQKIIAREVVRYGAIVVSEQVLSSIPSNVFQRCITDLLKTEGLSLLHWTPRCQQWLDRAQWLSTYNDSFPKISAEMLQESADTWLIPYICGIKSLSALKKQNIYDLLIANVTWEQQSELDVQAPIRYTSPSDKTVDIIYDKNQGPMVSIALQEMFGQLESPALAYGQVPLRFELLSPARRPIQTTSDLANFWVSSYFDVAKEMRAKYPKHRWPEKPLLAKPGRSRKPK